MQEIQVKVLQMEGGIWNKNSLFFYILWLLFLTSPEKTQNV